jgi:hypothetical protein
MSSRSVQSVLCAAALALSSLAAMPAVAQSGGDLILDADGVKYACAGVGKASRSDPRWTSFPVRLEFAAANGDFLGDPAVTVTDSSGKPVFQAKCDGPWVLIELPAGSYQVHATGQKGQYAKDFPLNVKAGGQTKKTIRLP